MKVIDKLKSINISKPVVIAAVVIFLYLPILSHLYFLAGEETKQAEFKQDPLAVLPTYAKDSRGYVEISENIINNHTFSDQHNAPHFPNTFRTPVFPFTLALWKIIFGSYKYFPLLQIALVLGTAVLILRIGSGFFSPATGMTAAVLYVFDPNTIFHSVILLSETEYVFFLVLAIYLFLNISPNGNLKLSSFLSGFVLGISALVRPMSMYLLPLFSVFYIYQYWQDLNTKKILVGISMIVLGYISITLPWMIRNKIVADSWQLSSARDYNFFEAYVPEYLSFKNKIDIGQAKAILVKEAGPLIRNDASTLENSSTIRTVYLSHIIADPVGYIGFHMFKTIPFYFASGLKNLFVSYNGVLSLNVFEVNSGNLTSMLLHGDVRGVWRELGVSGWVLLEQLIWLFLYIFGLAAILFKQNRSHVVLFWLIIIYFAVATGPVAYARFRLPVSPMIFLVAASGIFSAGEYFKTKFKE